jgi:threonine synthase
VARHEGIFAEPSSLASVAAIARLAHEGTIRDDALVVALLAATGLKDPARALEALRRAIEGGRLAPV